MASARRRRTGTGELSSPTCYLRELEPQRPPASSVGGDIVIRRIYEEPGATDGYRALIDRLWPRGVSRQRAALDVWLRELAPSTALRLWYGHDPQRFAEFARRYRAELRKNPERLADLRERARRGCVTLLTATREERINHAAVLRTLLLQGLRGRRSPQT
jgi:uncharacterized protein YeaO (DUF488 family)